MCFCALLHSPPPHFVFSSVWLGGVADFNEAHLRPILLPLFKPGLSFSRLPEYPVVSGRVTAESPVFLCLSSSEVVSLEKLSCFLTRFSFFLFSVPRCASASRFLFPVGLRLLQSGQPDSSHHCLLVFESFLVLEFFVLNFSPALELNLFELLPVSDSATVVQQKLKPDRILWPPWTQQSQSTGSWQ